MASSTKEDASVNLRELQAKREAIESELEENNTVLKNAGVGMKDPLTDSQDFPRADIPIHQVRLARVNIIRLQNDLHDVMTQIEKALHRYHHSQSNGNLVTEMTNSDVDKLPRLAVIDMVSPGSPAEKAGLKAGDIITEYGPVNASNFRSVQDIAQATDNSENYYMKVVVIRDGKRVRVNLKPCKWSGNGLLGCKVTPL